MTLQELSQLYHLNQEIDMLQIELEELEAETLSPAAQCLDGMPHVSGGRKTEEAGVRIAELTQVIADRLAQCEVERVRLEQYISSIPDSQTRMIFHLRFVGGLSWNNVADVIGSSEYSVKKICYRYVRKHQEDTKCAT